MVWLQGLMLFWVLAPGTAVYIKGHSHAADKARANIENLTCYRFAPRPEASAATIEIDRILNPSSRRSWVVLVMTDSQRHVVYEKKLEETPWPLPSAMSRLLKDLSKTTCTQFPRTLKSWADGNRGSPSYAQAAAPR